MENEPHEYVVTEMDAYPDEDVRPLDVRIECATDKGRIILRAKSVMVQQLLTMAFQAARDSQRGLQRRSTGQLTRA